MAKKFRDCVVAVFINDQKKLLLCKRKGMDAWQFPQGGIDEGETALEALYRECLEEIGTNKFKVLTQAKKAVSYEFPKSLKSNISNKYTGQSQTWFLCQFDKGVSPNLSKASDEEFDDLSWASANKAISLIIDWKKQAYKNGLSELGISYKGD